MGTTLLSNKSSICYQCGRNGKIPIYYRNENRVFRVAFYVCDYCMHFSGFINWTNHRSMPYFNDMEGMIRMRLVKYPKEKKKIFLMKKDPYSNCIKCKKYDYSKLYIRDRKEDTCNYLGYVCKNCKIGYFVNTPNLKFKTYSPQGYYKNDGSLPSFHGIPFNEYMGQFATSLGEDEEKPIEDQVIISIKKKDLDKLKKSKIQFKTI